MIYWCNMKGFDYQPGRCAHEVSGKRCREGATMASNVRGMKKMYCRDHWHAADDEPLIDDSKIIYLAERKKR